MENKIGLTDFKLKQVERDIINLKLKLLDDKFNFNEYIFSFEYLNKLHEFLFGDIYDNEYIKSRKLSDVEITFINVLLNHIKIICINNPDNIDDLISSIDELWNFQPFYNGNTRTFLGYLSVLNSMFLLNLDIDFDKEIESSFNVFKKENFVNQKKLTKAK